MMPLLRPRKWLVVFVKNQHGNERAFETLVTRLGGVLSKKPFAYDIKTLTEAESDALKQVGSVKTAHMQLSEDLSEKLFNKVIELKKEAKAQRVAVVLNRGDFGYEDAFLAAVNDTLFKDKAYYVICGRSNFLSIKKKLDCIRVQCCDRGNSLERCKHSCLARLLWLLFDEDDRVKDTLKEIAENDAKFV